MKKILFIISSLLCGSLFAGPVKYVQISTGALQAGTTVGFNVSSGTVVTFTAGNLPVNAKTYGALGDGATDDTAAIQRFLNACEDGSGYLPAGRYLISSLLTMRSGCQLYGAGPDLSVLVDTFPVSSTFMINENYNNAPTINVLIDKNMGIHGVGFDGNSVTNRNGAAFVNFIKTDGVTLTNCKFKDIFYIGAYIGGCHNVKVESCEFVNTGIRTVTAEGGASLQVANGNDLTISSAVYISGNYFHDSEWAGIYFTGVNSQIVNNRFINVKEAGIFGGIEYGVISNNVIRNVVVKYITGVGMEIQNFNSVISNNQISQIQGAGLAFTTNMRDSLVTGNDFRECGFGISIISLDPAAPIRNSRISENIIISTGFPAFAGISIGLTGGAVQNTIIEDNYIHITSYSATGFSTPIYLYSGLLNDTLIVRNNGLYATTEYGVFYSSIATTATSGPVNIAASSTFQDVLQVNLSTGIWDLSGAATFVANGATITGFSLAISTNSGSSTTNLSSGYNQIVIGETAYDTGSTQWLSIPKYILSLDTARTVYLKVRATFSAGTPQFSKGNILATRK